MLSTKSKEKLRQSKPIWFVLIGLLYLGVLIAVLLQGTDVALFNPKGLIAGEQHKLMVLAVSILLAVGIPTLLLFYFFAWRFRESSDKAVHDPSSQHSNFLVLIIWGIPITVMIVLATIMWPATHRLAPQKNIVNGTKPITIQVVAMRWKWLFIYPEQNIAAVNFVQIPTGTPVQFELSADDTPMSSFWIPHLSGQLYAMTGHVNHLNLMADTAGEYTGSSAEINGQGFAGMKFTARASSTQDFDQWVHDVKLSSRVLDSEEYSKLLRPSENNLASVYSKAESDLYDKMLLKYNGSHDHNTEQE
ncbi:cytochrome o ubiquinol oxidase subunit II [soil metagenome]